jgi:hypothetical protein
MTILQKKEALLPLTRRQNSAWTMLGTAFVSFAAGIFISSHLTHLQEVKAEGKRIFELDIYHAVPGRRPPSRSAFAQLQSSKPSTA